MKRVMAFLLVLFLIIPISSCSKESAGKPVVAADLPGVRSVVDDGEIGYLFKVKNKNQLLSKIRLLLQNKEKEKTFGFRARQRADQLYSQDKIWDRLEKVYLDLNK